MSRVVKIEEDPTLSSKAAIEKAQKEFNQEIAPLETSNSKDTHFNWSAILFIEGDLPEQALSEHVFGRILEHNDFETLLNQLSAFAFIAVDRCKESLSPKTQRSLRHALVIMTRMLKLYSKFLFEGSHPRVEPPHFNDEFYKKLLRLVLVTGDETVFEPNIVFFSNRLFAYLLSSPLYSALFLPFILYVTPAAPHSEDGTATRNETTRTMSYEVKYNRAKWVFQACFPRLLSYECDGSLRPCLPFVYSIIWSLCSSYDHDNFIQQFITHRTRQAKLKNLIELLILHITRGTEEGIEPRLSLSTPSTLATSVNYFDVSFDALQMLLNSCLFNEHFRHEFIQSEKFDSVWKVLFAIVPQTKYKERLPPRRDTGSNNLTADPQQSPDTLLLKQDLQARKSVLVLKLIYILLHNPHFRSKILEMPIEKTAKGLFGFSLLLPFSATDPKSMIDSGKSFSLLGWVNLLLANNVLKLKKKDENDEEYCFYYLPITSVCLRILYNISDMNLVKFRRDILLVKNLFEDFLKQLILTLKCTWDEFKRGELDAGVLRENVALIIHFVALLLNEDQLNEDRLLLLHSFVVENELVFTSILNTILFEIKKSQGGDNDDDHDEATTTTTTTTLALTHIMADEIIAENLSNLLKYITYFKELNKFYQEEEKNVMKGMMPSSFMQSGGRTITTDH